jgi:hypothetical protein
MCDWFDASQMLPDDEEMVMLFNPLSNDPVWPGYRDAGIWRDIDGITHLHPVTHWAYFPAPPVLPLN